MDIQRLYSYLRQTISEYNMIKDGDRIAVGISGGKDSLTLLYGLCGLSKFYPEKFEIVGITVDLGYGAVDFGGIRKICKELEVDYHIVDTQISAMVKDGECSLCARLRKGALMDEAISLGCNKIAYAHNMDDVVETMMLSLIYEGRFSSFWPVTHFDDCNMDVIRPMIGVPLEDVKGFVNKYDIPLIKNPCPYDKRTQRTYVRDLIKEINMQAPGVKKRMMTAIRNGDIEGWRNT